MLNITKLNGYYGNSRALKNVDLFVRDGGFLSILGRNGVGKTTLFKAMLGLLDKTDGQITLDGETISDYPTHRRARAGIGYVPQGRGILPNFTVRENLTLGTFARKDGSAAQYDELIFDLFPILKEFLNRKGGNLSGGQQQQLAIARALLTNPKIILLDEPMEGIQPNIVEQIENAVVTLNRKYNITIILVEQDISFARRASDTFALMEKGQVVAGGPVADLTDSLVHKHLAV